MYFVIIIISIETRKNKKEHIFAIILSGVFQKGI